MTRSVNGAYEPGGKTATDTLRAMLESAFAPPVPPAPTPEDVVGEHGGEVVWGGGIVDHYGHFLTESVARLWPLLPGGELEGTPVVLTTPRRTRYVRDWLQAFGVEAVELPERGAVRFTRVRVPEPALRHGVWIAPEIREIHLHARNRLDVPSTARNDVVWLSRSRLGRDRFAYDEGLLEWMLDEQVTILVPEAMSLAEQIGVLEGARGVAGLIGSAFHTLLMVENPPDCLYLCPPWDRPSYPAQHRLMSGEATFEQALEVVARARRAREPLVFPGGYRLRVPETLRALADTLLPSLLENRRLAAFAHPERQSRRDAMDGLDAAVLRVLREPLAIEPRLELGAMFEADGHVRCAAEQLAMAEQLAEERDYSADDTE